VKALGGAALALALAWSVRPGPFVLLSAALIALTANAFNLLDLRPLRTLKLFWLLGGLLAVPGPPLLRHLLVLSLLYAPLEARRRLMLGDTGSNALGGAVGMVSVLLLPVWAQALTVLLLLAFHLWAERYSLTAWIEAHPLAKRLDDLGWRHHEDGSGE
jgi:UDP-GlcNAc:undecaprenyl-phosphate/decaprenyl-phosphate GlcNAc-1-phosphate transferase